jgi:hypothetical protein
MLRVEGAFEFQAASDMPETLDTVAPFVEKLLQSVTVISTVLPSF